jgi:hypothetical protein
VVKTVGVVPIKRRLDMLRSLTDLRGSAIVATDGDLGSVYDFYFDDHFWHVRYIVVDTGKWLPGRRVLLSPGLLGTAAPASDDATSGRLYVNLTREQMRECPGIDTDPPVSRRLHAELATSQKWPAFLSPAATPDPGTLADEGASADADRKGSSEQDPDLRSFTEVCGYGIEASDGKIGHVEDFIVDDGIWVIRYFVVDTKNWLPGRKVLAWPQAIRSVSWTERRVHVDLDRATIKSSPEYDASDSIGRDYEIRLYAHYGKEGYWLGPSNRKNE